MGRPATKPAKLRDGFYIEVRNKGSKTGIKIRRDSEKAMLMAAKEYEKVKTVISAAHIPAKVPSLTLVSFQDNSNQLLLLSI